MKEEISQRIRKCVIEYTEHKKGGFISPIFFCLKSDWSTRLILNWKTLSEVLEYNHFKMETVHSVADLVQTYCYVTRMGLNDVHDSVKISEICCAAKWIVYRSMKVHKAHYATYCMFKNRRCYISNINDLIVIEEIYVECPIGNIKTVKLFVKLGFIINLEKSSLKPS